MDLDVPKVMGILNVTPDSFYCGSRKDSRERVSQRVEEIISEGADIIDVGGCSTRPGYQPPDVSEEIRRVDEACEIIRKFAPDFPLSIDTFRAEVARHAIKNWNANIINDISGGEDPEMWGLVAKEKVVYVLTHNRKENPGYQDVTAEVISELAKSMSELHRRSVNDVILDPGFGFAKTLEENFQIFAELKEFEKIGLPLLVGISRKSMIYKTLGVTPEESLAGTIALDAIALEKGADILRVHDVKQAVETVNLFKKLR